MSLWGIVATGSFLHQCVTLAKSLNTPEPSCPHCVLSEFRFINFSYQIWPKEGPPRKLFLFLYLLNFYSPQGISLPVSWSLEFIVLPWIGRGAHLSIWLTLLFWASTENRTLTLLRGYFLRDKLTVSQIRTEFQCLEDASLCSAKTWLFHVCWICAVWLGNELFSQKSTHLRK